MAQAFVNTIKWIISVVCFIIGVYCLRLVMDESTVKPLIISVLTFGVVYWFSKTTYEASKRVFLTGFAIVLGMGLLNYVILWAVIVSLFIPMGFYMAWTLSTLVVGIPVMTWVHWKEER